MVEGAEVLRTDSRRWRHYGASPWRRLRGRVPCPCARPHSSGSMARARSNARSASAKRSEASSTLPMMMCERTCSGAGERPEAATAWVAAIRAVAMWPPLNATSALANAAAATSSLAAAGSGGAAAAAAPTGARAGASARGRRRRGGPGRGGGRADRGLRRGQPPWLGGRGGRPVAGRDGAAVLSPALGCAVGDAAAGSARPRPTGAGGVAPGGAAGGGAAGEGGASAGTGWGGAVGCDSRAWPVTRGPRTRAIPTTAITVAVSTPERDTQMASAGAARARRPPRSATATSCPGCCRSWPASLPGGRRAAS